MPRHRMERLAQRTATAKGETHDSATKAISSARCKFRKDSFFSRNRVRNRFLHVHLGAEKWNNKKWRAARSKNTIMTRIQLASARTNFLLIFSSTFAIHYYSVESSSPLDTLVNTAMWTVSTPRTTWAHNRCADEWMNEWMHVGCSTVSARRSTECWMQTWKL